MNVLSIFSSVAGMTFAGGRILYGSSVDGALRSVAFANGAVQVPNDLAEIVKAIELYA